MESALDFGRALGASVYLLRKSKEGLSTLCLLKLLYLADRQSLLAFGDTITGAKYKVLPKGPVPEEVYALLKGRGAHQDVWDQHIQRNSRKHRASSRATESQLSLDDKEILDRTFSEYGALQGEQLSRLTHSFSEWSPDKEYITPEEILVQNGKQELLEIWRELDTIHRENLALFGEEILAGV